ncbi:zinc/iron regulated transporter-related protein 71B isoform X2 [Lycorma delicatula]|uniref:zinc/iron regulated transporter-related protein 71B isoform X2 n=1 Tax=Lycorma delicatula TaxID=130591 RepID=UPI003F5157A8
MNTDCYKMKLLILIFIYNFNSVTLSSTEQQNTEQKNDAITLPNSNIFLEYIFEKYGNDGKLSYEGFEHLLENLGLGQLKFDIAHTVEEHRIGKGKFEDMHDKKQLHKHNHTNKIRNERSSRTEKVYSRDNFNRYSPTSVNSMYKRCFTIEEMLSMYNLEPNHELVILPNNFLLMCPVLVYELDQKSCNIQKQNMINSHMRASLPNTYFVWLSASVSVIIISLVGLLGVCMVPLLQRTFFNELVSFLVALAVGTLCGDSFLHLLPHAFEIKENENINMVTLRAGTVFLAFLIFFLIETVLSNRNKEADNEHIENDGANKTDFQLQEKSALNTFHSHSHSPVKHSDSMSSVALMVIMGDGLHNLTDGLAIGAAFSGDLIAGFTTAIAVFTHELPHELGDFAVLLQSGMSVNQAVFYNIVSSILSIIGMAVGLLVGKYSSASQWVYSVTAGVFLYIALVNLVPEMKRPDNGGKVNIIIQVAGIMCGGTIMFLIALFEHDLENMFS